MRKSLREEMAHRLGADVVKVVGKRYDKPAFRACWSYFYSNGQDSKAKASHIEHAIPGAVVLGHGDHQHAFVGGAKAGSAQDTFFWVDFRMPAAELATRTN